MAGEENKSIMQKKTATPFTTFDSRVLVAFTPRFVGTFLAILSFATTPAFAYPRPGETTTCIGVRPDGTPTPSSTYGAGISGDGSLVAFQSFAPNLVPGDTNGRIDVFVRDVLTGTTGRVSVASDGTQATDESQYPNILGDITSLDMSSGGRYVAFIGRAANLVPGDTNNTWDVFVHDLIEHTTERISVATGGTEMANGGVSPNISADGRFVAFASDGLFVRDRVTGVTERVDVSSSGEPANFYSYGPSVSDDGRFVAFQSSANNLDPDPSENIYASGAAIYLRDRALGITKRITGPASDTQANGYSWMPDISGDGRYIAYYSAATDLIPNDTNRGNDVFVYDRLSGATRRVSVASDGTQAEVNSSSYAVAISRDGRFVTFSSSASNLVRADSNVATDVFVHDLQLGITERVSVTTGGSEGALSKISEFSAISDDGSAVAFESLAGLVPGGDNGVENVYRRLRGAPIDILQASVSQSGGSGQLSGTATFAGAIISAATHPAQPQPSMDVPGGYIASAELVVRPEQEDLRVRLVVPTLPSVQVSGLAGRLACFEVGCPPSVTNSPYVGYRLDFVLGGAPYRIVLDGTGAVLENCATTCLPVGAVTPQVGTTGTEVLVTVPLSMLGSAYGTPLNGIIVTSTLLASAAPPQDVDTLSLPDTVLSGPTVRIGVAPPGVPPEAVSYTGNATPNAGAFTATFAGPPDGSAAVLWAQPCVGATCGSAMSWPLTAIPPVKLVRVVSRKDHGSAGTFDIDLPLTGNPGIECRSGGANGDYTLIFTFANSLTSVGSASVSSGTGSVSNQAIGADAHQYVVDLTDVANAQTITLSLTNVTDSVGNFSSEIVGSMGVLIGDVNANGVVSNTDVAAIKVQVAASVTSSNFRTDVNANGVISNTDVSEVKAQVGTTLP
jgi:Tol biopolymer transport system component